LGSPLLTVSKLTKRFGVLRALQDVTFSLDPGEIVGLVGRRGSGKSTLLQLLGGYYPPTSGEIIFRNHPIRTHRPAQARDLGIELVPQTPLLIDSDDTLMNIFLGREVSRKFSIGVLDWPTMSRRAQKIFEEFDLPARLLARRVEHLPEEIRQVVAITRALCVHPRLLLLDESLATLSFPRQQILLDHIRHLSQNGTSVLISSDSMNHLFAATHRILVLYEGRLSADRKTRESTPRDIVELVVGSTDREQVTPIIWALESYHSAQEKTEELVRMQDSLRQNLEQKDSLNRQLIERLKNQLAALDQLNAALQATQRRLMTEREEERKSLARELHDQIIQDLLSYNYRLEEVDENVLPGTLQPELASIRDGIRQVVSDIRQVCSDLRPPTIDRHGLSAAIRSYAQEWAERNNIDLHLKIDESLGRFPETIELSMFRIVQEGLNNIRKHSAARNARVELERTPTAGLSLLLSDDGMGTMKPIDLSRLSVDKHFGLLGISERVTLLGGSMQVKTSPSGGLILLVEIPNPSPIFAN
jgi:signal transduction histidine kinase